MDSYEPGAFVSFQVGGGGRGAEDVMGILSVNTCGFMAFWCCSFDVAGFDSGLQGHFVTA